MRYLILTLIIALCIQIVWADDFLVPLDDRPANRLFVEQIARIGSPGTELKTAPRHLLGRLYTPGDCEAIAEWIEKRVQPGDTVFLCADMWLYGGLVASRTADVSSDQVAVRLARLKRLSQNGVKLRVLATIPRLSLRTSDKQAEHERQIAAWAAKEGLPSAASLLGESTLPEIKDVPEDVLREYLQVRVRNTSTLAQLVELTSQGHIDSLVLGQDDSHEHGLHRHEHGALLGKIEELRVGDRVHLMSGIDELSMNMVAGTLLERASRQPTVRVIYSEPEAASKVPPLETLPLDEMVTQHLELAGATVVEDDSAEVDLFIYVPYKKPWGLPGEERRPPAEAFVGQVAQAQASGRRVALADLSLVNRMDPFLAESVMEKLDLPVLQGFASWNTPANTVGTVVAQLTCHRLAETSEDWPLRQRLESEKTHQAFLMARLIDDYAYQTVVRDAVKPQTDGLSSQSRPLLNEFGPVGLDVRLRLIQWANETFDKHFLGRIIRLEPHQREYQFVRSKLEVVLPWPRTFEVEARLDLRLVPVSKVTDQTDGGAQNRN